MKIVITGAGGFVGRHLSRKLIAHGGFSQLTLIDRVPPPAVSGRVRYIQGELGDKAVVREATGGGVDVLFHLASLPGGTSENEPGRSRAVNLDASLNLFEAAVAKSRKAKLVFASSIAVFGLPMPGKIDDDTPALPTLTYGTHKRMCELALADMSRRGDGCGISLRLPGIAARPKTPNGLKSAFISDVFHALLAGDRFVCPTSAAGTIWAMSVDCCVGNLMHASTLPAENVVSGLNLPALRCSMGDLVTAIAHETGRSAALVRFDPDPDVEALFAKLPELETARAAALGFRSDGDLRTLVRRVLETLKAA